MKSKQLNYLLIVLVVAVWGLIIYRLYDAATGNDGGNIPPPEIAKKEIFNDYALSKDTGSLSLHYRDPFGMVKTKDTLSYHPALTATSPGIKIKPQAPKPAMNWDFIKYVGYIGGANSKKVFALVHINGQETMLAEGESAGALKLLKNMRDSIKISYGGSVKYISIKPASL